MKKTLLAFGAALLLVSCSEDSNDDTQDTVAPQILSATLNGEDHDLSFSAGSNVQLSVEASDNSELGQLKLDIHDSFDGHGHGKNASSAWQHTEIIDLSGANATANKALTVPDPVTAGPYHMVLRLLDASGNESEFKEVDFLVTNGSEPQFNISDPDFSSEVHAPKGQKLIISGNITDDIDLDEVVITIAEEEEHDHAHKMATGEIFTADIDLDGSADTSFDLSTVDILIPTSAETGHYEFKISAKDSEGNYAVFSAEIHVM